MTEPSSSYPPPSFPILRRLFLDGLGETDVRMRDVGSRLQHLDALMLENLGLTRYHLDHTLFQKSPANFALS